MSNDRHSRDEVTTAINKLREKHPTALLTVEDLKFLTNSMYEDEESPEADVAIRWDTSSQDDEDN